jgi:3-hydroxyisobutyrate dehydrogenase-like beta-hydroxyacid dehydrogenase
MAYQHRDHRLGWVGIGQMGGELVGRLRAAGCDVSVCLSRRCRVGARGVTTS